MGLVPCEKGGVASQTVGTEPKKESNLGGAEALFDPIEEIPL